MKAITSICLISFLIACGSKKKVEEILLPYYHDETFTAYWPEEGNILLDTLHRIPAFKFINQDGKVIGNEEFDGGIYVANFFFTSCPTVCPKMEANLSFIQDEFMSDDRVKLISHSVMPWADSVARLQDYAEMNDVRSGKWHLVTGEKEELYKMGRLAYFADEGFGKGLTALDDFLHTENIILVDQKRRIRGIYNGTLRLEMKRLASDIQLLLKES